MRVIEVSPDTPYAPLAPSYTTEHPILMAGLPWVNPNQFVWSMSYSKNGSVAPDTPYSKIIQEADTYKAAKALGRQRLLKSDMRLNANDPRMVNSLIKQYKGKVSTRTDWKFTGTPLALFANMQKFEQMPPLKKLLRKPFESNELAFYNVSTCTDDNVMGKILTALGYQAVHGDCDDMPRELQQKITLFTPDTGPYTWRERDGSWRTVFYKKGKQHGPEQVYWGNGQLYRETMWKNDVKDGAEKIYTKHGALKSENTWVNGELVVLKVEKYPDGTTKSIIPATLSGKNGVEIEYFPDGTVWARRTYKNGKRHGLTETFYENGFPRVKSEWKDDEKDGSYRLWGADGVLQEHEIWKKGKADPIERLDVSGYGLCRDCGGETGSEKASCDSCMADSRQVMELVASGEIVMSV